MTLSNTLSPKEKIKRLRDSGYDLANINAVFIDVSPDTSTTEGRDMKTYVSVTQQMLNGEITMAAAVKEIKQLTPPKKYSDYDGLHYEGDRKNTFMAMKALGFDQNTGKYDKNRQQRIRELIEKVIETEEAE